MIKNKPKRKELFSFEERMEDKIDSTIMWARILAGILFTILITFVGYTIRNSIKISAIEAKLPEYEAKIENSTNRDLFYNAIQDCNVRVKKLTAIINKDQKAIKEADDTLESLRMQRLNLDNYLKSRGLPSINQTYR